MERNIALVQERAKNEADLDENWVEDDHDQEDLGRHISSRNSSPDNDFVDVESTERPLSSASTSSQKIGDRGGPPIIPAMPEVKRGRGRPRKNRDNLEEGKWIAVDVFFLFYYLFCFFFYYFIYM